MCVKWLYNILLLHMLLMLSQHIFILRLYMSYWFILMRNNNHFYLYPNHLQPSVLRRSPKKTLITDYSAEGRWSQSVPGYIFGVQLGVGDTNLLTHNPGSGTSLSHSSHLFPCETQSFLFYYFLKKCLSYSYHL